MDKDVLCLFGFTLEEAENTADQEIVLFTSQMIIGPCHQIYYDEAYCDLVSFQEFCKERVFQQFEYRVHPRLSKEPVQYWIEKCQEIEWQQRLAASDYQDFGVKVFANLLSGKDRICDRDSFLKMKGLLKGCPAFVCGAGPSFKEAIPFLKNQKNKGVILAGGAALGKASLAGVPVHVGAGLDPDPLYEKVLMQSRFEASFFYQSRFSSTILNTVQGPLFQVPSTPGYGLEQWLEEKQPFDSGWTVSTFCVALAVHLGCNPIVLVGVDLSIPYEEGIKNSESKMLYEDPVKGKVWTQKDWILSARWLEHTACSYPEISFYNTSFSGLTIKGFEVLSLQSYMENGKIVDAEAFSHLIAAHWQRASSLDKLDKLEESLYRSGNYLDELLFLFEQHYPEDPSNKGSFVVSLFDLTDEIFYQQVLEPLWKFWRFPIERKLDDAYAKVLNQFLFFKRIYSEYKVCVCKKNAIKSQMENSF